MPRNGMVGEAGEPFTSDLNSLSEKCGETAALTDKGNFQRPPHQDAPPTVADRYGAGVEKAGVRVLVCGGRDYLDLGNVWSQLDAQHGITGVAVVIHGGATGADDLARRWAEFNGVPTLAFPADWQRHGNAAGPIRNRQMIREGRPDLVLAFPGGRGTRDMVSCAKVAGVTVEFIS